MPAEQNTSSGTALVVLQSAHAVGDALVRGAAAVAWASSAGDAAFALAFIALSGIGGAAADRLDPAAWARRVAVAGAAATGLGAWAVATGDAWGLMAVTAALAVRSALFGPVKYAVLPRWFGEAAVVSAAGAMAASTGLSLIFGAWFAATAPAWVVAAALAATGAVALVAAAALPSTPPASSGPLPGPGTASWGALEALGRDPGRRDAALGLAVLWGLGAVALRVATPAEALSLGVGFAVGAVLAIAASFRRVELGLAPVGGLTVALAGLALAATGWGWVVLGLGAAWWMVPLTAWLAWRAPDDERGAMFGGLNLVSGVVMALGALPWEAGPALWLGLAAVTIAVTARMLWMIPDFLLRLLGWALSRVLYRVQAEGLERVPVDGPAVVVANHVTFVDWLVLGGLVKRPMRFVMYAGFYENPVARFICDRGRVIPIAGKNEDPARMEAAFVAIQNELADGQVVCIFPEGALTKDGQMAPFRRGIERILAETPVPVVPMSLNGLWGSMFSRSGRTRPRRLRSPVWVRVGAVQPPTVDAVTLETIVKQLWERGPVP